MTIEQIGIIVGISATVSAGTIYISKEIKRIIHRRWKWFEGEWSNKAFFDTMLGGNLVDLTLSVNHAERYLIGKAVITTSKTNEIYLVKCYGKLRINSALMRLVIYFDNELGTGVAAVGKLKLTHVKNHIKWEATNLHNEPGGSTPPFAQIIPAKLKLWQPSKEFDELKELKARMANKGSIQ